MTPPDPTTPAIDLDSCAQEPIHIPGAIQPHGVLFVLRVTDLVITQVSASVTNLCGKEPADVLEQSLDCVLVKEDVQRTIDALALQEASAKPAYLLTVQGGTQHFDAIAHRVGDRYVLELEPSTHHVRRYSTSELYHLTQLAIERLRNVTSLEVGYEVCAEQIRRLTGFDRVMIYRFDAEWNGTVIAEQKREDLEPFLGLHYPASDIPAQARELYRRNTLRFIGDRTYTPSPLVPAVDPQKNAPLDMSLSVLRSVSPVHLEYLRNMGVSASMSVSLMHGDQLWGLIACHHYSPRLLSYDLRIACELLGHVMSLQLISQEDEKLSAYDDRMREVRATLTAQMDQEPAVERALTAGSATLLDLIDASGAAVVVDNDVHRIGQTPGEDDLRHIVEWLESRRGEDDAATGGVFATDRLASHIGSNSLSMLAAGLLAITITRKRRFHILWFRPEQVRTVHWAGDPSKSVVKGAEGVRLSPRGSFALWKQTLHGRSAPWTQSELAAARDLRSDVAGAILRHAEGLARAHQTLKLADAEKEQQLARERSARETAERVNRLTDEFVATLSHELRTPLNAILGYAQLLRLSANSPPEEIQQTVEIIERNARIQTQMIDDLLDVNRITSGKLRLDTQPVDLPSVVEAGIATMRPAAQAKGIELLQVIDPLIGVDVTGDPDRLQQIFWNLISNAIKFTPKAGRVQVLLERVDSHVEISVSDTGQGIAPEFLPHVFERFRQADAGSNRKHTGLGLGLAIVRSLVELHGGSIQAQSAGIGHGSTFTVSLPVRIARRRVNIEHPSAHPTDASGSLLDCDALNLQNLRVLVLDDEPDTRALIRRMLVGCEADVTLAASVAEAMEKVSTTQFDAIISDIGMPDEDGYTFIARLRELEEQLNRPRTPTVALTAYATADDRRRIMLAGYQMHVAKPVEPAELMAVVANIAGRV